MGSRFKCEQGVCPKCRSKNIEYGAAEFEDDLLYYPGKCNECGYEFEEWYALEFIGQNIEGGHVCLDKDQKYTFPNQNVDSDKEEK